MDCTFHGVAKRQTQLSDFHFQVALVVNNPLASARDARDCVWSLDHEASLQKGIAAHSSILPCKMPWTEEPAALQPMGSQRVRHNWATKCILHIRQKQGHIKCNTMSNKYITNDKRIFTSLLPHFLAVSMGFPGGTCGEESTCLCKRLWIPGSGRSLGVGRGNSLWYSCLGNSIDRGAWQATIYEVSQSWAWLSD